jgi:hypothetical protein
MKNETNKTNKTNKTTFDVNGSRALTKLEIRDDNRVLAQFTNGDKWKYVGVNDEIIAGLKSAEKPTSYFMANVRNNSTIESYQL